MVSGSHPNARNHQDGNTDDTEGSSDCIRINSAIMLVKTDNTNCQNKPRQQEEQEEKSTHINHSLSILIRSSFSRNSLSTRARYEFSFSLASSQPGGNNL